MNDRLHTKKNNVVKNDFPKIGHKIYHQLFNFELTFCNLYGTQIRFRHMNA